MGWNAITSFQEASNELVVALFCHAYNCARYTSCIMINDGLHFTAICYSTLNNTHSSLIVALTNGHLHLYAKQSEPFQFSIQTASESNCQLSIFEAHVVLFNLLWTMPTAILKPFPPTFMIAIDLGLRAGVLLFQCFNFSCLQIYMLSP